MKKHSEKESTHFYIPVGLQSANFGAEFTRDLNDFDVKNSKEYSPYFEDFLHQNRLKVDVKSDAQVRTLKSDRYRLNSRLFFALLLDDTLKETLVTFIKSLKKSFHPIRWTKPENLHITLHFIGNVLPEKIPLLVSNVQQKITGLTTFDIEFTALLLFPPSRHPHTLAVEIRPSPPLLNLAHEIREGSIEAGLVGDKKTYIPHVTLGKLKIPPHINFTNQKINFPKLPVTQVVLLESIQAAEGVEYQTVEKIKLGVGSLKR